MHLKLCLKSFVYILVMLLGLSNAYAKIQCPSLEIVRLVGLDHVTFVGFWNMYAGYQTHHYGTNKTWEFRIGNIEAKGYEDAFNKLTMEIPKLKYREGPLKEIYLDKPIWICRYYVDQYVVAYTSTEA